MSHEDIATWMRTVRDPAEAAKEPRVTVAVKGAAASYEIALLPDGRWAVRIQTRCEPGSNLGCPWQACATRQECVRCFLEVAHWHFDRPGHTDREEAAHAKMRKALARLQEPVQQPLFAPKEIA